MERLKMMKEQLMSAAQGELGNLGQADAKELGEVIDMIKDLSEAVYYCTIVKSMEESEKEGKKEKEYTPMYYPMMYSPMDYERMYYEGGGSSRGYRENQPRDSQGRFTERGYSEFNYAQGGGNSGGGNSGSGGGGSRNYPIELRDYREGQSPLTRKTYMERKMHGGDKAAQMQELEKYMHELTSDLTEMVEGASPEEKQMLKQKLSTLSSKIV